MTHRCGPGECTETACPGRRLSTRARLLLLPEELSRHLVCGEGGPGAWQLSLLRRCPSCPRLGQSLVGVHDVTDHGAVFTVEGPTVNSTVVRFRRMLEALR